MYQAPRIDVYGANNAYGYNQYGGYNQYNQGYGYGQPVVVDPYMTPATVIDNRPKR